MPYIIYIYIKHSICSILPICMCKFHECSSNFILFLFFNLYHLFLSRLGFIPTGPILSSETPAGQVRDCQGPSAACIDLYSYPALPLQKND